MKRTILNITFIGLGTALGFLCTQFLPSYAKSERTPPKIIVDDSAVQRGGQFTTSFAPVIKKAAPSVVTISASRTIKPRDLKDSPLFDNPWFRQFFGDPDEQQQLRPRPQKEEALGSGVIVSEDGYILTANHVVDGADDIKIELPDGKDYSAKVVGTDPPTDAAVLKIEATGLPAITLANSERLEVGDIVLAIGNPFGIGQTVTMGIVSATGRGELGISMYEDFIQTDAAINMGNSGGALVDAAGRLVGINTAMLSRTGGNQGVGFAIPINMARHVMEMLITNGKVTRGFLGVRLQELTPDLAEHLDLKQQQGALVVSVEDNTPASEAGLKPGDLIVEFNGKKVQGQRQLQLMVSQMPPNTKVNFKVLRGEKTKNFQVTLAELPNERMLSKMLRRSTPDQEEKSEALEGVEVGDLDSRSRRQYNIPARIHGALVTNVDPDSHAADAGLRQGDVIVEIERKPVKNADEAVEMTNSFKGKQILLRVWSRGSEGWLLVDVDQGSADQDAKPKGKQRPRDHQEEDQQ